MILKKIIISVLMLAFIYMTTFDIFLNSYLRFPSPLICLPLILFFRASDFQVTYLKELLVLIVGNFLVYAIYSEDFKAFFVNIMTIIACAVYFIFFVGNNLKRLKLSVLFFIIFLFLSSLVMLLDHYYHPRILILREMLIGGIVMQSPSGITSKVFTFGYQLAALTSFIFIYSFAYNKSPWIKGIIIIFCFICIFLGMQRSVLVTFFVSGILFLIYYYKYKAVLIVGTGIIITALLYVFVLKEQTQGYNNILAKNERNANEDRGGLVVENLKIYTDYPYGLIFYGKKWKEVVRGNRAFGFEGITSHNAYLMFITYLGPFLGLTILYLMYKRIVQIFKYAVYNIKLKENALLLCLCFSFLAVSINALFHNAWLLNASGPAIFLYFAIFQLHQVHSAANPVNP